MDQSARRGGASDAHVGVHLPQSVTDGGEVAAQVLHHVLDAAGVFEQVDALRVRVVVHRERTLDRLGKLPVAETRHTQEVRLSKRLIRSNVSHVSLLLKAFLQSVHFFGSESLCVC